MRPAIKPGNAVGATDARGLTVKTLALIDGIAARNQVAMSKLLSCVAAGETVTDASCKLIPRHASKKAVPQVGSAVSEAR